ncbi:hypothetical protein B0H11DRAFT_69715 [Mycena galericulata]|nr:hypothetical protein B0H11DRAFT_69715 [Mycena galericulata]
MTLPPELIAAIVAEIHASDDAFHLLLSDSAPILRTLKACALVSRAFLRPAQIQIFSAVDLNSEDPRFQQFSQLLLHAQHIASYVRHLRIVYSLDDAGPLAEILAGLPNLEEANFYPDWENPSWRAHPTPLKAAFAIALSRPTLRHVSIVRCRFVHAKELHALLGNSVGLKHLTLRYITFDNQDDRPDSEAVQPAPKILINSLELTSLTLANVNSIISAFTIVGITRLRSLDLRDTPLTNLLRANAATLQRLEICLILRHILANKPEDMDVLADAHQLTSIRLRIIDSSMMDTAFRLFGNLAHLTTLRNLTVEVFGHIAFDDEHIWRRVDAILSSARLEAVEVVTSKLQKVVLGSSQRTCEPQRLLTKWMPRLIKKGIVYIHPSS